MEIQQNVPEELLITRADEPTPGNASLIAYAETAQDVSDFLVKANKEDKKVITIGAHTGLAGAAYPNQGEWLLSLERMNKIISLDEETLTLNVEAGVTLEAIRAFLTETPYFYAPDPGAKEATVGGNAGTNAGGMRAIKYGVTRDNIRGMDVVLPTGEIIHVGSLNKKNASGYDVKDLFIGQEGTLGVITSLQLKLIPKPHYEQSLLIGFEQLSDLAPVVYEILTSPVDPVALELLEGNGVAYSERFLNMKMPAVIGSDFLLLTVDANEQEALEKAMKELEVIANQAGASDTRILSSEEAVLMWQIRDNILNGIYAAATTKMYDPCVPTNKTTDLILQSKQFADELNIASAFFGHAGDGNIHICVLKENYSDDEWQVLLNQYEDRLYPLIAELDGLPSAEHGIGLEKKEYMSHFYSEEYMNLLRTIKRAIDPNNILNPGKIFDL